MILDILARDAKINIAVYRDYNRELIIIVHQDRYSCMTDKCENYSFWLTLAYSPQESPPLILIHMAYFFHNFIPE